jgi:hypothetical protein
LVSFAIKPLLPHPPLIDRQLTHGRLFTVELERESFTSLLRNVDGQFARQLQTVGIIVNVNPKFFRDFLDHGRYFPVQSVRAVPKMAAATFNLHRTVRSVKMSFSACGRNHGPLVALLEKLRRA